MKKLYTLLIFFLLTGLYSLKAQVAINTDASLPDPSAMLDIKSTTKGLLVPRVTSAGRIAFPTPADGLLVYDTDTKGFWYYMAGTGWTQFLITGGTSTFTIPFSATVNSALTLFSLTNSGTGAAASFATSNNTNITNILNATSNGPGVIADHSKGNAGNFFMNNTNGVGAGVRGEVNSIFGNNGTAGVYGTSSGTGGYGGYFEHSATTGFGIALYSITNGLGAGSNFITNNASNGQPTILATTNGTGSAFSASSSNANNITTNTVNVTSIGNGNIPDHTVGNAGNFFLNNTNGVGAGVRGEVNSIFGNNGTAGVYGTASGTGGYGGYFEHSSTTGFGNAMAVINNGLGIGANFVNNNATNAQATIATSTGGTGSAFTASNSNNSNINTNTVNVTSNGNGNIPDHSVGNAGNFFINNTNGVGAGVRGEVNSIFGNNGTAGVYGTASGTGGYGGYFEHSSTTGFGNAVAVINNGLGIGANFINNNATNAQTMIATSTSGTGSAFTASSTNTNNLNSNALNVTSVGSGNIPNHAFGNAGNFFMNNTNGVGAGVRGEVNSIFGNNGTAGVYGISSGTGGYGGYFEHSNATGFGLALYANTSGQGVVAHFETLPTTNGQSTVEAFTSGTGSVLSVSNSNNSNVSNIVNVTTNGPGVIADHSRGNAGNFFVNNTSAVAAGVRGEVNSIFGNAGTAGVYGVSSGTGGYAGYFDHTSASGFGISVEVVQHGQGTAMVVDHEGPSGDLAIFSTAGSNKARISRTGQGFFDGGTTTGGADVAEAFDVEGNSSDYEPGDVLIISETADRTVARSTKAYSSLVAGVYATRPGVLLTDLSVNSDMSRRVPMGVVGVIPTKVCDEGGPIRRGDILVTSSRPGFAMRADLNKLKAGQAIGKALQPFTGTTGKINVLVNVK